MEQLSGADAMFLHAELDGLPQHIGGVTIYNQATADGGVVRFKQILAMLEARLHESPVFRRKLQFVPMNLGRPYWVEDPDFDLEYHVRHIALPKPGDWRQLCILAARLHAQPLRRDKALWEIYIIEGLDNVEGLPPNCFAMLLKIHHCAMDGSTGPQFMNIMHDLSPETREPSKAPPWIVQQPSAARLLTRAYVDMLKKPGKFAGMLKQSVPAFNRIRRGVKQNDFHLLEEKQKTRFQGKISRHRVVNGCTFDFATIRAIKNTVAGATINDAMLTIVAGGMRKYLDSKGELPEGQLVTGCPIDVRSPEERATGGNMIGYMNVGLRTDIVDPAERLAAIHEESDNAKAYAEALGPRIMMDLTDVMPGNVIALAMRASSLTGLTESKPTMNTIVTNVPGAPFSLYMCGAEMIHSFSLGPLLPGVGLFHVVYSTVQNKKGSITLSFTACRKQLPDPDFYTQCLNDSFEELRAATLGSETTAKPRRSNTRKKTATASSSEATAQATGND